MVVLVSVSLIILYSTYAVAKQLAQLLDQRLNQQNWFV